MKRCPSCNRTYSDIVQYCSVCKTRLEMDGATSTGFNTGVHENTEHINKCPSCGRIYADNVAVCELCHVHLKRVVRIKNADTSFFAKKGSITENCHLRGISGHNYKLTTKLAEGGEGVIYSLQSEQSVAKIYKKDIPQQESKLIFMVDHNIPNKLCGGGKDTLSLAWPTDVLYDCQGEFVGYVMPKVEGDLEIFEVARGAQSKKVLAMWPEYNWMINLEVAKNLAEAIAYLHSYNCIIGDMNCKNILVNQDRSVTILDCDSFDLTDPVAKKHYKCGAATEDYLAPELQGRNLREESAIFSKHTDEFALAVHIFQLLMDNRYPFTGIKFAKPKNSQAVNARLDNVAKGLCPYLKQNTGITIPPGAPLLEETLPDFLIEDFQHTFGYDELTALTNADKRTLAATWAQHLGDLCSGTVAGTRLAYCPHNKYHIMLLDKNVCGFCEAEQRYKNIFSCDKVNNSIPQGEPEPGKSQEQNKNSNIFLWVVGWVAAVVICFYIGGVFDSDYDKGMKAFKNGDYTKAAQLFSKSNDKKSQEMFKETQYQVAKKLFNNKEFEKAASIYESLNGYKESQQLQYKSLYMQADIENNKHNYRSAVDLYKKIPLTYMDSNEKLNVAMVNYINEHMDCTNQTTYSYMNSLKTNPPKGFDLDTKYRELYSWKIEIVNVTNDKDNYSNNDNRSFKKGEKTYISFKLIGGEPGKTTKINTVWISRGRRSNLKYDDDLSNGNISGAVFTYYNNIDMYFYDSVGNQIGYTKLYAK